MDRLFTSPDGASKSELLTKFEDFVARAKPKQGLSDSRVLVESTPQWPPSWRDEFRCLPNETLRSALFNARNRQAPRRHLKNELIAVVYNTATITYSGEELRQNDELVWLQLVHLAKAVAAGEAVEFSPYGFASALRLSKTNTNGQHVDRVRESILRMQATSLSVHSPRLRKTVSLSMIPKFEWQDIATGERLQKWRAHVAPELIALFDEKHITRLNWRQRLLLPAGLATWMHGYFSTHRQPIPLHLDELHRASGCITKSPRRFKQLAGAAIEALKDVGFLSEGTIQGVFIRVKRK